jgi:hypothetical protein
MDLIEKATQNLIVAWPHIVAECRQVLGSELHYQAMVYHNLRTHAEIPIDQIGMNVKMWIDDPVSELFRKLDERKNKDYRGGFEPIPDICLFSKEVSGDWRRRNNKCTLSSLLLAIEVKASERMGGRLRAGEIINDIRKLSAHRQEAQALGSSFLPVMMIIDTAPQESERMTRYSFEASESEAQALEVGFMYLSPDVDTYSLSNS